MASEVVAFVGLLESWNLGLLVFWNPGFLVFWSSGMFLGFVPAAERSVTPARLFLDFLRPIKRVKD